MVRTRMAPSPTGEYHIGHIRTVLYNVALSKKNNGKFILRIEDTDRARLVEGALDRILDIIEDYGFNWDEGPRIGGEHGPYVQSERLPIYKKYAEELIEKGNAYYCFCTSERLAEMREEQKKAGVASTKYDRTCLKLSKEEVQKKLSDGITYVIRLKVPDNELISFHDEVFGDISIQTSEIDDQVLLKSDGFPTYQLAVVVDDHLMEITHVMRGNDWLPSTPKHVILYKAFGWEMPVHIHLPNLKELGANKKLSKRFGPVSAREFLDQGYLKEALINFLMFLGWNPGNDKEFYTLEEFIKDFDVNKIHKTDLVAFDRKKLDWYNSQYIMKLSDTEFAEAVKPFTSEKATKEKLEELAPLIKSRIIKLSDFNELAGFFFEEPTIDKDLFGGEYKDHLTSAIEIIEKIDNWQLDSLNEKLMTEVKEKNYKTGDFFMSLRVAITGQKFTPPINDSIIILDKEKTLSRFKKALDV